MHQNLFSQKRNCSKNLLQIETYSISQNLGSSCQANAKAYADCTFCCMNAKLFHMNPMFRRELPELTYQPLFGLGQVCQLALPIKDPPGIQAHWSKCSVSFS